MIDSSWGQALCFTRHMDRTAAENPLFNYRASLLPSGGADLEGGNALAPSDLHLAPRSMQKAFLRNEKFISNILRHFLQTENLLCRLRIGLWTLNQTEEGQRVE